MKTRYLNYSAFILCASLIVDAQADFVDVTKSSGILEKNDSFLVRESWGVVSCDWNKDGLIDVVLNNHRDEMKLFKNNGNFTFSDSSALLSNPVGDTDEHGVVCADFFPGDKYLEIALTAGGDHTNPRQYRKFYRYDAKRNKFVDKADELDFQIKDEPGRSLLIADFNGDHRLDLFESARKRSGSSATGTGPYLYSVSSKTFTKMPDSLNAACLNSDIEFSQYTNMDADEYPEIACAGNVVVQGLFEIDTDGGSGKHFHDIWNEVGSGAKYGQVRDMVVADFNNDKKPDMFLVRRGSSPGNVALQSGEIRAKLVTVNGYKEFTFSAGNQVVTLDFSAPYLASNTNVFYGAKKVTDSSFRPPWINLLTTKLDPKDSRFLGVATSYGKEGLYIGFDGRDWHVRLYSQARQQFDGHLYATRPLTELALKNFNPHADARTPLLLLNNAGGFTNYAGQNGFKDKIDVLAAEGGDFDNDRDTDLFLVMSNPPEDYGDRLYVNDGKGTFTLKQTLPAVKPGSGENIAVADFNQDGCLDMVVVNGFGEKPNNRGRVQVLKGQCNSTNKWIQFDLDGLTPHGLGATVEVEYGSRRDKKLQDGGARRFGQNAQRLHFGLGAGVTKVDVYVAWEGGAKTSYLNVPTNKVYLLNEDGSYSVR